MSGPLTLVLLYSLFYKMCVIGSGEMIHKFSLYVTDLTLRLLKKIKLVMLILPIAWKVCVFVGHIFLILAILLTFFDNVALYIMVLLCLLKVKYKKQ